MSTFTCPNGHASTSSDYCDTCGVPVPAGAASGAGATPPDPTGAAAGAGAAGGAPTPDPTGATGSLDLGSAAGAAGTAAGLQPCPNCAAPHDAAALFCEACGYDFTTGTMPRPPDASTGAEVNVVAAASGEDQASLAPAIAVDWVAEVWVDPDWYEAQESEEPCPSPGLPAVVELAAKSVLIGRPSTSRNIHPEIDCTGDSGVSRRQAQLTTDGQRWWVEDLQSSNGTYVGPASGPLPTDPVPPGQRRELSEDDRIYVGAWTRLVVRRATPEERGQ
ncbi:MAG TPA: FHA domain-containing protein [Ornithinibacter sp.]|nr:FHA domain-containing protein [Ornithinibacter sp.]